MNQLSINEIMVVPSKKKNTAKLQKTLKKDNKNCKKCNAASLRGEIRILHSGKVWLCHNGLQKSQKIQRKHVKNQYPLFLKTQELGCPTKSSHIGSEEGMGRREKEKMFSYCRTHCYRKLQKSKV